MQYIFNLSTLGEYRDTVHLLLKSIIYLDNLTLTHVYGKASTVRSWTIPLNGLI